MTTSRRGGLQVRWGVSVTALLLFVCGESMQAGAAMTEPMGHASRVMEGAAACTRSGVGGGVQPTTQPVRDVRDLRDVLAPIREKSGVPSLAAVAIRDGSIVAQGCVGVRAAGGAEEATINDKFHLGSCTKSMTATMIARLVDRGTMRWDMTLAEVFPERVTLIHEGFRGVRLDQLLTNRGGLPREAPDDLWAKLWTRQGTPTEQRLQLLDGVCAAAPAYEPGMKFVYSNQCFAVAGAMAERASGRAWEDLMRELLFEPLGITSAGFGAPGSSDVVDQPRGHRGSAPDFKAVVPGNEADNPPAIGPAGTVHMNLPDWARYIALHARADHALLDDKPADDPAFGLVSKSSMAKLHQAIDGEGDGVRNSDNSGYAMGWGVGERPWAHGRVLTHSGSNTMWFCVVWIAPKRDFAVLIATNAGGDAGQACDQAAGAVIASVLTGK